MSSTTKPRGNRAESPPTPPAAPEPGIGIEVSAAGLSALVLPGSDLAERFASWREQAASSDRARAAHADIQSQLDQARQELEATRPRYRAAVGSADAREAVALSEKIQQAERRITVLEEAASASRAALERVEREAALWRQSVVSGLRDLAQLRAERKRLGTFVNSRVWEETKRRAEWLRATRHTRKQDDAIGSAIAALTGLAEPAPTGWNKAEQLGAVPPDST